MHSVLVSSAAWCCLSNVSGTVARTARDQIRSIEWDAPFYTRALARLIEGHHKSNEGTPWDERIDRSILTCSETSDKTFVPKGRFKEATRATSNKIRESTISHARQQYHTQSGSKNRTRLTLQIADTDRTQQYGQRSPGNGKCRMGCLDRP